MVQNGTGFHWTTRAELAARLAADDRQSDEAIAAACEIGRQTLARWKRHPDFQARLEEHVAAQRAALLAEGIANKKNRIAAKNRRWAKLERVLEARGADPSMTGVPGGETGTLVRTVKWVRRYSVRLRSSADYEENETDEYESPADREDRSFMAPDGTVLVEEYAVDTGLLAEMDRLETDAAKELGQWVEKSSETVHAGEGFLEALRSFASGPDASGQAGAATDSEPT